MREKLRILKDGLQHDGLRYATSRPHRSWHLSPSIHDSGLRSCARVFFPHNSQRLAKLERSKTVFVLPSWISATSPGSAPTLLHGITKFSDQMFSVICCSVGEHSRCTSNDAQQLRSSPCENNQKQNRVLASIEKKDRAATVPAMIWCAACFPSAQDNGQRRKPWKEGLASFPTRQVGS